MKKIHIVIDSTAGISKGLLARHSNLHQVSLKVLLGAREWDEDQLSPAELFAEMKVSDFFPKTSQPPLGAFVQLFETIRAAGGEILVLAVSGGLSGTAQGAASAAQAVGAGAIRVIDTKTTTLGLVNMTCRALAMIEEGYSLDEIAARMRTLADATHLLLLTDSLEYLHRGGRIGGAAALFGTILRIKPILYLADGKIAVLKKVRTRSGAIAGMLEELKNYQKLAYIGVAHVEAAAEAENIACRARAYFPEATVEVGAAGAVLASHVGPAALGLIFQEKIGVEPEF